MLRSLTVFLSSSALVLTLAAVPLSAQSTSGSILGDVTDASGALLPGATVRATNEATGAVRETLTNELGAYRFNGLPPANYALSVEFSGFATVRRQNVTLPVASEIKIDFRMEVGSVAENITVTEEAPLVQTTENAVRTIIDNRRIEELPLKTRDFLNLTLLAPGVVMDQSSAVVNTTESISFGGMPERYKSIWLEGVDFNDEVTTGGTAQSSATRTGISQEAIQEFQVMANSYSTEFGRSSSGTINVVVKSGGNDIHGNAYYFQRDDAFDKPNFFAQKVPPFTNRQFGGTFGGPILKDKTHYFLGFERKKKDEGVAVVIPNSLRDYVQSLNLGYDVSSDVSQVKTENNAIAKVTHAISAAHALSLTYLYEKRLFLNENIGGSVTRDQGYDDRRRSYFFVGKITSLLGQGTVNELRLSRSIQVSVRDIPRGVKFLPGLNFPGALFGVSGGNPQNRIQKNWILANTMSHQIGQHNLKWGFEENVVWATADANRTFNGLYEFLQDRPVVAGDATSLPYRFTLGVKLQPGGDPTFASMRRDVIMHAVFLNDTWRFRQNLTFTYGIRYDLRLFRTDIGGEHFPENISEGDFWVGLVTGRYAGRNFRPIPPDTKDISPRMGFSWDVFNSGRTVVRGGYGLYHDRINTSGLRSVVLDYPGLYTTQVANDARLTGRQNDFFPRVPDPSTLPTTGSASFPVPSRTATTPYTQQTALGVQQALSTNWAFSGDYVRIFGLHYERTRNVNARLSNGTFPLIASGTRMILNHDTSNVIKIHMLQGRLEKRFTNRFGMLFGYTLMNAKWFQETPTDNYDREVDWGPMPNDVRHRLISNAMYELPFGIHFGGVMTFNTSAPYTETSGTDTNRDLNNNDRPAGVGYNSRRGDRFFTLDLRSSKKFKFNESMNLEVLWEMFNLFNNVNFTNYQGNRLASNFGRPRAAFDPFQAQLGVKFTF